MVYIVGNTVRLLMVSHTIYLPILFTINHSKQPSQVYTWNHVAKECLTLANVPDLLFLIFFRFC